MVLIIYQNVTYSEKPSDSFKKVLWKSGFIHMVNNFKVAGKYWRGCRSFNSLHEYEDYEFQEAKCKVLTGIFSIMQDLFFKLRISSRNGAMEQWPSG